MSRNQTSGNNCYRPIPPHGKDAPSIVPDDDEDGYLRRLLVNSAHTVLLCSKHAKTDISLELPSSH